MIAQLTKTATTTTDREYWVTRNGQPTKRRWDELSETERRLQREAEERAAYTMMFNIY